MDAPAPVNTSIKRKNSITPLFAAKKPKPGDAANDLVNISVYLLRKDYNREWDNIAEDLNVRFNRGGSDLLSGGACYNRFVKHAEAIARSRGEDYRKEWYVAEPHNRASLAVDSYTLNEAIYLFRKEDDKSWQEIALAVNAKYDLNGSRGREPVTSEVCYSRFRNYGASIARTRKEPFEKEWYSRIPKYRKADPAAVEPSKVRRPGPVVQQPSNHSQPNKPDSIKKEPAPDPDTNFPYSRGRQDSDCIVVASRPASEKKREHKPAVPVTATALIKPVAPLVPAMASDQGNKVVKPQQKTTKTNLGDGGTKIKRTKSVDLSELRPKIRKRAEEGQSKTQNATRSSDELVMEAYSKIKADVWRQVSGMVSFGSDGRVELTEEQCKEIVFARKTSI